MRSLFHKLTALFAASEKAVRLPPALLDGLEVRSELASLVLSFCRCSRRLQTGRKALCVAPPAMPRLRLSRHANKLALQQASPADGTGQAASLQNSKRGDCDKHMLRTTTYQRRCRTTNSSPRDTESTWDFGIASSLCLVFTTKQGIFGHTS